MPKKKKKRVNSNSGTNAMGTHKRMGRSGETVGGEEQDGGRTGWIYPLNTSRTMENVLQNTEIESGLILR